jgi:membrane associated rhomboid family serine protease
MSLPSPPDNPGVSGLGAIIALVVLCVGIEAVLQLGDLGIIDVPRFRSTVYEYGGFWSGLLENWRPNYPLQPWAMFVTYGFLHGGLMHLGLNMVTLVSLALPVARRVGGAKMLLIYALAMLGGGLGFALLSDSFRPMVGASGALFGLAGAILAWEYIDRFTLQERLWPVARAILFLAALNVALYYAMDRVLAWEAHLGGFIMGWIAALLIDPRADVGPEADDPET